MPTIIALLRTNLVLKSSRQTRLASIGAVVPVIPPRARAVLDILAPLMNGKVCVPHRGEIATKLARCLSRDVAEKVGCARRAVVVAHGGFEKAEGALRAVAHVVFRDGLKARLADAGAGVVAARMLCCPGVCAVVAKAGIYIMLVLSKRARMALVFIVRPGYRILEMSKLTPDALRAKMTLSITSIVHRYPRLVHARLTCTVIL